MPTEAIRILWGGICRVENKAQPYGITLV